MILILLMPLALYGIFEKIRPHTEEGCAALAGALLCYEGIILLLANILSIGHSLNAMTTSAAWLILDLFLFTFPRDSRQDGILLPMLKKRGQKLREGITSLPGKLRKLRTSLGLWEKVLLCLSILLCLILLFLALFTVPYNYDSQTYHLARIAHWIDNKSVNYYLTSIDRQLYSPVLSEYHLLFMLLLGGSDLLLNLHQYASMLLSAYFIFVILKKLGTSRLFCFFGVFVYLTMPLTMSQAITTQNDLGAALWYLIFLYYVLCFLDAAPLRAAFDKHTSDTPTTDRRTTGKHATDKHSTQKNATDKHTIDKRTTDKHNTNTDKYSTDKHSAGTHTTGNRQHSTVSSLLLYVCIGASVGFAFLQKPSVCASMVMFLPWVLVVCIRRKDKLLSLIKAGITALLTMLLVISETLIRTYIACGSLMSSTTGGDIMVATKNVRYILVNILKNYSLLITQHFITDLNGFIYRIAISAGRILQVEVNNEAIAFHGFDFITYLNTGLDMYSHDRTSSAFAAYLSLLGGILLVVCLIARLIALLSGKGANFQKPQHGSDAKKEAKGESGNASTDNRRCPAYAPISYGFVISAWLGFGFIMALLRWQPWGSRLMYPALVAATVASVHILGQLLSQIGSRKPSLQADLTQTGQMQDTQSGTTSSSSLASAKPALKQQSGLQQMARIEQAAGIPACPGADTIILLLLCALTILLAIKPLADNSTVALSYLSSGLDKGKKEALMFESHKHSYDSYMQLIEQLEKTNPQDIALVISGDGYDYPLWRMVRDRFPNARIRHIIVDDTKMVTLDASPRTLPDCILWIERGYKEIGTHLDYFGDVYTCGFVTDAPETCDGIFYYDSIVNRKSKPALTAVE